MGLEPPLLQILVVVANNQERTSLADVEKGSMSTSVEHGLVRPKPKDKVPVSLCVPHVSLEERKGGVLYLTFE